MKELIALVDLPALVAQYAGPGKHRGNRWLFCCPHPQHADGSPSFSVKLYADGVWRAACMSQCGKVGDALSFVKWLEHCDDRTAADKLRTFIGQPQPLGNYYAPSKAKQHRSAAFELAKHDPGYTVRDDSKALSAYLSSRCWPDEAAQHFGLRVVTLNRSRETDTLRALHPFHDYDANGKLCEIAWQARRLDNASEARWLGPLGIPLPLYNLGALEGDNISAAIICEGPADTVTAWLATNDLPGVACVGVAGVNGWRDEWAEMFRGLAVIIAADNDEAGERFTWQLARQLHGVASSLVGACPPAGTNDLTDMLRSCGLGEVRKLLTSALPNAAPKVSDMAAYALSVFAGSFTVCAVCAKPTEGSYCAACSKLTRPATRRSKPYKWAACDKCGQHSLGSNGKSCWRFRCGGSFVTCEVQP
jgi:DNA primase